MHRMVRLESITGKIRFCVGVLSLAVIATSATAQSVMTLDLDKYLKSISFGSKNTNQWVKPPAETRTVFQSSLAKLLAGNTAAAHAMAQSIGYEVQIIYDTENDLRQHYVLRESLTATDSEFTGGGTYLFHPLGRNVAIEAPHPVFDLRTGKQAIDAYLGAKARFLLLPGLRRDNHTELSPCTNGKYRVSDASHNDKMLFFTAHATISDHDAATVFVQYHGFGTTSGKKLRNQCHSANNLLVNLSEGVKYQSDLSEPSLMQFLKQAIDTGGLIDTCLYGNQSKSLGGRWTTTGRHSNGSADACHVNAAASSRRFLHIEQSYDVRKLHQNEMLRYLNTALDMYFQ